uniref:Glycoprotein ORF-P n=1 Tax=Elephant endotheliotropic herpesvirus 1A TaxID=759753 RepID=A0A455LHQ4_ELHV1|nr:glycoprotein ORF-P [Elephant endotheliotropic herpesvirus 1A]
MLLIICILLYTQAVYATSSNNTSKYEYLLVYQIKPAAPRDNYTFLVTFPLTCSGFTDKTTTTYHLNSTSIWHYKYNDYTYIIETHYKDSDNKSQPIIPHGNNSFLFDSISDFDDFSQCSSNAHLLFKVPQNSHLKYTNYTYSGVIHRHLFSFLEIPRYVLDNLNSLLIYKNGIKSHRIKRWWFSPYIKPIIEWITAHVNPSSSPPSANSSVSLSTTSASSFPTVIGSSTMSESSTSRATSSSALTTLTTSPTGSDSSLTSSWSTDISSSSTGKQILPSSKDPTSETVPPNKTTTANSQHTTVSVISSTTTQSSSPSSTSSVSTVSTNASSSSSTTSVPTTVSATTQSSSSSPAFSVSTVSITDSKISSTFSVSVASTQTPTYLTSISTNPQSTSLGLGSTTTSMIQNVASTSTATSHVVSPTSSQLSSTDTLDTTSITSANTNSPTSSSVGSSGSSLASESSSATSSISTTSKVIQSTSIIGTHRFGKYLNTTIL